ncbi:MAG: Hsp70 family protein [Ruminococcus sp.]|nr:Hsp70 family protein [Ruminococcus sp.]
MKLEELIGNGLSEKTALDVMVQIIEIYNQNKNDSSFVIRAENFEVQKTDSLPGNEEVYFDITYKKVMSYDNYFRPVPESVENERNAVFCTGMLMYQIISGHTPDIREAERFSEFIGKEKSFRFCTYEKAYGKQGQGAGILWEIISRATDLNIMKRPSVNEIMMSIISEYPSYAGVKLVDIVSGKCLDVLRTDIHSVYSLWKTEEIFSYDGKKYLSENPDFVVKIPYRICVREYTYPLIPDNSPCAENLPLQKISGKQCIGIDFGMCTSSVSFLNDNGHTESIFYGREAVPTVIFYKSKDKYICGEKAVEYQKMYPEAVSGNFKRNIDINDVIHITAENGDILTETCYSSVVRYLRYLYCEAKKKLNFTDENCRIVMTVPAYFDSGMKTAFLTAGKEAGFIPDILTEPEAVTFFFSTRNDYTGNILVIDIGGGSTDISIINLSRDAKNRPLIHSEYINGFSKSGGEDMTVTLYNELIKKLLRNNDINMTKENVSGLDRKKFRENTDIIRNIAESMKKTLSGEIVAEYEVSLNIAGKDEKEDVLFRMKRKPYEILIREHITRLRNKIKKSSEDSGMDIKNVIVTGRVSETPAIRSMIEKLFPASDYTVHYIDCKSAVSRGAVIYANRLAEHTGGIQSISKLTYDIGVLFSGAYGTKPMFRCLAEADTPLSEQGLTVSTVCVPTCEEKEKKFLRLYLYRRPKEFSFVESTFDPQGDVIRPIGYLYTEEFPEKFSLSAGKVKFDITFDSQECISADVLFYMPENNKYIQVGNGKAFFRAG